MDWWFRLRGFEDLDGRVTDVRIHGDAGRNWLSAVGCSARIDGSAGNDVISAYVDSVRPDAACHAVLQGGSGSDRMQGDVNDDVLLGGDGRDTARGAQGTDTCVAERELGCER
jgi:Ca2+-binding RTX toxin-like protein